MVSLNSCLFDVSLRSPPKKLLHGITALFSSCVTFNTKKKFRNGSTCWCKAEGDEEGGVTLGAGSREFMEGRYLADCPEETARCRVLLLGSGADELLGGYSRHVTALRKRGQAALREEMLLDLRRLWTRNLGRDDRIISGFGREPRHPFLDEEVLKFVGKLPLPALLGTLDGSSCGSEHETKWILRQVALDLRLPRAAGFKKRAIQFGSRVSRDSNIRHFGTNRKARGDAPYVPRAC